MAGDKTTAQITCAQCGATFEVFRKQGWGSQRYCGRQCVLATQRAKAKAKRLENIDAWRAKKREEYHRLAKTPSRRAYAKEYRSRETTKARQREWARKAHQANPEYWNKRSAEWRLKNPEARNAAVRNCNAKRRAQQRSGLTGSEVRAWSAKQKKVCYWCGVDCRKSYHVDHYVPLSKGGPHELQNLVIACATCNIRKNARDPIEFAHSIGRLL